MLAATNRPDVSRSGAAAPRPLRSTWLSSNRPDKAGRCEAILEVHTRGVPTRARRRPRLRSLSRDARSGWRGPPQPRQRGGAAGCAPRTKPGHPSGFLDAMEKIVLGPRARDGAEPRGPPSRGRPTTRRHALVGLLVPGRRSGERVTDRAARAGARRHVLAPRRRHRCNYTGAATCGADPGSAGRTDRRGDDLQRHEADRRRERHQAGDRPRAPDGDPLGNE